MVEKTKVNFIICCMHKIQTFPIKQQWRVKQQERFSNSALLVFVLGLISDAHTHHLHPQKCYPHFLTSTTCAGIVGFTRQHITTCHSTRVVRLAFWPSPLLTCAMGIMFICIGTKRVWQLV